MDLQEKIDKIVILLVALICILISILDFIDALDSIPWISQRVPIMTLLAVGLIAIYLVLQNNRDIKRIGHRVKTLPYSEGYIELQKKILNAKKEILILTQYLNIFDWENGIPKWDTERRNSPHRKAFYCSLQSKLKIEKGNTNFKFVKIVQIPKGHKLQEMLLYDQFYAENCKFIIEIAKNEPEFACLRKSGMSFGNSIILIDGSFAHISFDIQDPDVYEVNAPCVLLIDDPNSEAIKHLIKLYRKVEANSKKVELSEI